MTVQTLYQVTHERLEKEGKMFTDKAEAQRYDKMMDIAFAFCTVIESHINGADEKEVEDFAIFLAQHGEQVAKGFKGSADALYELLQPQSESKQSKSTPRKKSTPAAQIDAA